MSQYIYEANGVRFLDVVRFIKTAADNGAVDVALSESLATDNRVTYFYDTRVNLKVLPTKNITFDMLPRGVPTLLDVRVSPDLAQNLMKDSFQKEHQVVVRVIPTPWKEIDTLIVYKQ